MKKLVEFIKKCKFIIFFVLGLLFIRCFFVFLILNNIPDIGIDKSTWVFWWGGDELNYFRIAKDFLDWQFLPRSFPLGYPIFLLPFITIFKAQVLSDIYIPVVAVNSIIVYTAVTILVYYLAKQFWQKKIVPLVISGFFLVYPYLFYWFFDNFATDNPIINSFKINRFGQLQFFLSISDFLSMLLMLGALLLFINIIKKQQYNWKKILALGLMTSWAVVTRMQNFVVLPIYFFVLIYYKKYKSALYFTLANLPLGLLQIYANIKANGSLFNSVYNEELEERLGTAIFSIKNISKLFEYTTRYSPILLYLALIASGIMIVGTYKMIKKNSQTGIIIGLYFYANLILLSCVAMSYLNPRYFLPIIPIAFIVFYLGFEYVGLSIYKNVQRKKNSDNNSGL